MKLEKYLVPEQQVTFCSPNHPGSNQGKSLSIESAEWKSSNGLLASQHIFCIIGPLCVIIVHCEPSSTIPLAVYIDDLLLSPDDLGRLCSSIINHDQPLSSAKCHLQAIAGLLEDNTALQELVLNKNGITQVGTEASCRNPWSSGWNLRIWPGIETAVVCIGGCFGGWVK